MPVGVVTSTSARAAAAVFPSGPEARWFVVGLTDRGPVDRAVRVRSLAQFEASFGGAVNYSAMHEQMRAYFGEGGYEAWIARVVGPAAEKATVSLDAGKLVVTALNPGAFANGWTAAYTAASKTLTIVTDTGTETYTGTDLAAVLTAAAASTTVKVTSSGSLPAADVAASPLASGSDDRANVTATVAGAALDLFDQSIGAGAVSIPGWSASAVGSALLAHARVAPGRIIIQGTARTDSLAQANAVADALRSQDSEGNMAVVWPWLPTPSGATISPEGAVAGHRAMIIRDNGVWTPPAGGNGALRYVTGIDQAATRIQVDEAHDDHAVNVIRIVRGGPRVYGWRSLSLDEANFRYLHYRDVLNTIRQNAELALEQYVYAPMTPALAQNARGTMMGVLKPFIDGGGLFASIDEDGNEIDPGWSVSVEFTMGTAGEGFLDVAVAVRPAPAAELIRVPITKVAVGAALN